jgi:hypothetical protein
VPVNEILIRKAQHFFFSTTLGNKNFVATDRSNSGLEGLFSLYFIQGIINTVHAKVYNAGFNSRLL